jgi:hypothetical protein
MTERQTLAFCSWLVEAGDTLIDNYGAEWWTALGPATTSTAGARSTRASTATAAGSRTALPVDDFRYGRRIERSRQCTQ